LGCPGRVVGGYRCLKGDAKASTRAPGREPTGAVKSPWVAGWFGVKRRLPAHPLVKLILA